MSYYNLDWTDQTTGITKDTTFVNRQHDRTNDIWFVGRLCGLTNEQVVDDCDQFLNKFDTIDAQYNTTFDIETRYTETLQMLKWTVQTIKTAAEQNQNTTCICSEFPSKKEGKDIMEAFKPSSGTPVLFSPFIRVMYQVTGAEPETQDIQLSADNCRAVYRVLYENGDPTAPEWLRLSHAISENNQ